MTATMDAARGTGPATAKVAGALGTVYVVWGSTYLAIRLMVEDMPPLVGAGLRFLAAGTLVGAALLVRHGLRALAVTRRELLGCTLIGLLLPAGGQGLVAIGENGGAPSGITALLIATVPLWVVCLRVLARERPPRRTCVGVIAGFTGVAALIAAHGLGDAFPAWAMAVIVLAGLSWALGTWIQPRLRLPKDPFVLVCYEMLTGGAALALIGLSSGERFDPAAYSAGSWAAWAYLVLFGSIFALSAYAWLLQHVSVSLVATYAYVNPLVAVLLGWLLLGEPLGPFTVLGGLVVIGSAAAVIAAEHKKPIERTTT
ncbi:EamA family transporter [Glycomyces harbinensis]|uniref:Permease of the drug/metabolite transporter (DMT) superfamily n=1 Tax=Glycomyces harbinensis TaxID=58114 RepID=A0A1G6ZMD4_9ACTN|nr:EamA family transporter [Glycomyces harbinensis]SDE03593.1 Permease of the drug/metabolite transporter (DMT) superfamily [Glycomyces harbinensis]